MSAWAKPGVKCVCINTEGYWVEREDGRTYPNEFGPNEVLTVAYVRFSALDGETLIALWGTPLDEWYVVSSFRPLTNPSQEDDVRLIKSLLVTEGADA
jgi:hypothetical protein